MSKLIAVEKIHHYSDTLLAKNTCILSGKVHRHLRGKQEELPKSKDLNKLGVLIARSTKVLLASRFSLIAPHLCAAPTYSFGSCIG
jgi:arginine/lysine/ornithine decarboxylase